LEEEKHELSEQARKRSSLSPETSSETLSSLIEKTQRSSKDFENEKGEISNIEHIYKKVFGN
jgi:hypothetical protein